MTVFINLRRKVFIMVFFNSSLCLSGKKSITNYQSWKPCNTYNLFIYLFIYSCIHIFIFFIHLYIYSLFYIMKNQYILEEKCLSWFCQAQPSQNPSLASAWLGWDGLISTWSSRPPTDPTPIPTHPWKNNSNNLNNTFWIYSFHYKGITNFQAQN